MKVNYSCVVLMLLVCTACTTGMDAVLKTAIGALPGKRDSSAVRLDPKFRWLRVATQGGYVHLALGYEDTHPLGKIEVWYSGTREVLRLQNGRIAGATGLTTEWRSVSLHDAPAWTSVAGTERPVRWIRTRDVMPGYRFGVRDQLEVRAMRPPKQLALQGVDAQRLSWFEERVVPLGDSRANSASGHDLLPVARYAVDMRGEGAIVIYGEQCLAPELCFAWQRVTP